jgi:tetratricopeptide (TPR) repeat protein
MYRAKAISILLFFIICTLTTNLKAQDAVALFRQAESFERAFRDEDALNKYKEVVKLEPANITALCKISELYSVIGKRLSDKDKQREYYNKGVEFAKAALKVNPNHSEANFTMAISMGRVALIASGEEKIKAVKDIKHYADRCVQIDPRNFKGYHVLGKWHYEVSDLSSIERWLVKVTYGALPAASINESVKNYEKSRQLSPDFLLNYLELAKAYKRKNDNKKARTLLEQLEKLPPSTSDDAKIKGLGKKLLAEL